MWLHEDGIEDSEGVLSVGGVDSFKAHGNRIQRNLSSKCQRYFECRGLLHVLLPLLISYFSRAPINWTPCHPENINNNYGILFKTKYNIISTFDHF